MPGESDENLPLAKEGSDDDLRPFSRQERKEIRNLLQADKRRMWLISTIKAIAVWIGAVGAGIAVIQTLLRERFWIGHP